NDKTFAIAAREEMDEFLNLQGKGPGPFAGALKEASGRMPLVLALNSSMLPPGAAAELPEPVQPLARAKMVQVMADFGTELRLEVRLAFGDDEEAKLGEKSAKAGLGMAKEALENFKKEMQSKLTPDKADKGSLADFPEAAGSLLALGFIHMAEDVLKDIPMKRQGEVVSASVTLPSIVSSSVVSNAAVGAG